MDQDLDSCAGSFPILQDLAGEERWAMHVLRWQLEVGSEARFAELLRDRKEMYENGGKPKNQSPILDECQ